MAKNEWIATRWERRKDTEVFTEGITIDRMTSPFYSGVKFAVRLHGRVLNVKGEWEWEPLPSARNDAFYARCRFDTIDAAQGAAEKVSDR